jgi:predicted HNH restriction endonuclease
MISLIDSERERDILKNELDTRNKLDTLREEVIEHFVREIKENQTTNVQSLFVQMYQENPDNTTLKEIADRANFETEQSLYQRVSDEYERDVYVTISFEEWQENEGR